MSEPVVATSAGSGAGHSDKDEALNQRLASQENARKDAIRRTFQPLSCPALGIGVAVVLALMTAAASIVLTRGGGEAGGAVGALMRSLPGFELTTMGSLIGGVYAGLFGFVLGFLSAWFRNLGLKVVLRRAMWKADRWRRNLLDLV